MGYTQFSAVVPATRYAADAFPLARANANFTASHPQASRVSRPAPHLSSTNAISPSDQVRARSTPPSFGQSSYLTLGLLGAPGWSQEGPSCLAALEKQGWRWSRSLTWTRLPSIALLARQAAA